MIFQFSCQIDWFLVADKAVDAVFHEVIPYSRELNSSFSWKFIVSTFKNQVKIQKFEIVNPISFSTFLFLGFLCLHKLEPVPQPYPAKYYSIPVPLLHILSCDSPHLMYLWDQVLVTILTHILPYHFLSIPVSVSPKIVQKTQNSTEVSSLTPLSSPSLHAATLNCQKCKSGLSS